MNNLHVIHRMMNLQKNILLDYLRMKMSHLMNIHLLMELMNKNLLMMFVEMMSKMKIAELMVAKYHTMSENLRMKSVSHHKMIAVMMSMKTLLVEQSFVRRCLDCCMMSRLMCMKIQMNIHLVTHLMSSRLDHLNMMKNPLVTDLMNKKTKQNLMILVAYFLMMLLAQTA